MQNSSSYKYENIQIGNFLVSVGYYLRDFNYNHPVSINLHQQTPNDFTVGDLFGAFAGKFFIIEFKNGEKYISEELKKPQRRRLIQKLNKDFKSLIETSIKGHFICYPTFNNRTMSFNFDPYVTIDNEKYTKHAIKGTQEFLINVLKNSLIGVSFKEIKSYIKLLQKCSEEEGKKKSSGVGSGILLNFDKDEGVKYYIFENLNFLEKQVRLDKEIIHEFNKNLEKDRENERDFGRGM